MSHVTNVILCIGGLDDDWYVQNEVNPWLAKQGVVRLFKPVSGWGDDDPTAYTAGSKVMEADVFLGAFNHFDLDEFIAMLRAIPWKEPKLTQCFIQDQHEECFTERIHQEAA